MYQEAYRLLKQGELVAIPTETVYGLAANALNTEAVSKIYAIKGRPSYNPLIIHVSDLEMAQNYGIFSSTTQEIAKHFWYENQKPLTLIVPRKENCTLSPLVSANLPTIAIRRPHHKMALELIKVFNKPLAAPSANLSNTISPTNALMVKKQFPDLFVLDGGECLVGLESTIFDIESFEILRPGGCTESDLEKFLEKRIFYNTNPELIKSPGQMKKHYAPSIPLRINATSHDLKEAYVTFGLGDTPFSISPSGDFQEAASRLYSTLFKIDQSGKFSSIAVSPIPKKELGIAINNRLERAAWS
jgi:L-threonylcarbamoyladenylate synthase